MDPKTLEAIREKHPSCVVLSAKAGSDLIEVAVVPPSRHAWRRFKACITDERKKPDAFELLVRDCTVHPDPAGLEAMLDRRPALAETFGDALCELAGAGLEVEKNA